MDITDVRAKSKEELKDMVLSLRKEQFNLRMQASTGALENRSRFKEARRELARAKTVLTEIASGKTVVAKAKTKKAAAPKKAPAKKAKKG